MKLPSIKSVKSLKGKRVLLRVDLNVLGSGNKIDDIYRVQRILPTIKYLKSKKAKIIILSYLSKGRGTTLRPVANHINRKYFKTKFYNGVIGRSVGERIDSMKDGEILVLENLHLDKKNRARDMKNESKFAKELAALGDIFVNDAFSQSHRKYASTSAITKYLPSYGGSLLLEEIKYLSHAFNPPHPFLLILGGIKFKSKLGVLEKFLKRADTIFIGGALANVFFRGKGMSIGKSIFDRKVNIKKYLNNKKIMLPLDVRMEKGVILDIGDDTEKALASVIKKAKFIIWNGPLGDIEEGFGSGTKKIAKLISMSKAKSILGGGDTIGFLEEMGYLKKFSFVSTGGGAMLAFLAKGTLPGIEALKN